MGNDTKINIALLIILPIDFQQFKIEYEEANSKYPNMLAIKISEKETVVILPNY